MRYLPDPARLAQPLSILNRPTARIISPSFRLLALVQLLALLLTLLPPAQSARAAEPSAPTPAAQPARPYDPDQSVIYPQPDGFAWWMHPRFGYDSNGDGVLDYDSNPGFVRSTRFTVHLNGCTSTDERLRSNSNSTTYKYRFLITGNGAGTDPNPPFQNKCKLTATLPEGTFTVALDVQGPDGASLGHWEQAVTVDDILIVSMGDSYGSGEGNPDIPQQYYINGKVRADAKWVDRRCHRSATAGAMQAALELENADPQTSITFFSVACSGATISTPDPDDPKKGSGMLGGYIGIEPEGAKELLPPQVDRVREIVAGEAGGLPVRPIDHMLMSIGGNDLQFAKLIEECTLVISCYDEREHPGIVKRLRDRKAELPGKYRALGEAVKSIPTRKVYLTEYPNQTLDDDGTFCGTTKTIWNEPLLLGITENELKWFYRDLLVPLNTHFMPTAAAQNGWTFVGGVAAPFGTPGKPGGHGYCADNTWLRRSPESQILQGPSVLGDNLPIIFTKGTLHPNARGQQVYKEAILKALTGVANLDAPKFSIVHSNEGYTSNEQNGWLVGACPDNGGECVPWTVSSVFIEDPDGLAWSEMDDGWNSEVGYLVKLSDTRWEWRFAFTDTRIVPLTFAALDKEGNYASFGYEAKVDLNNPDLAATPVRLPVAEGFFNAPVDVRLKGWDWGAGISYVKYRLDGGAWQQVPEGHQFGVTGDGIHTVQHQAVDGAGRTSTLTTDTVKLDLRAPATSATLAPAANRAGWSRIDTAVTLRADDGTGAGSASITYSATGAQPIAQTTVTGGSVTIPINRQGMTTITYSARDKVGNVAATRTAIVKLDKTLPTITHAGPANGATVKGTVPLTATAADNYGVGHVKFLVDDAVVGTDATGPNPYTFGWNSKSTWDGTHAVNSCAIDVADNATATPSRTVKVDNVPGTQAPPVHTSLISASQPAGKFYAHGEEPSTSTTGRYVAFKGAGDELIPGDTNKKADIFVRDRDADRDGIFDEADSGATRTVRVSLTSAGAQSNDHSHEPSISGDGRYVAFHSWATNLVPGDTNGKTDVFLHDRDTDRDGVFDERGATSIRRISVSERAAQITVTNGYASHAFVSANGRHVTFEALATNLVPAGDGDSQYGRSQIYVYDTLNRTLRKVSVTSASMAADGHAYRPSISGDGRYVAFITAARNFYGSGAYHRQGVWVHDRDADRDGLFDEKGAMQNVQISVSPSGEEANNTHLNRPVLSADGRYVAWDSLASNLVYGDTNRVNDVFVRDRDADGDKVFDEPGAARTERISVSTCGVQANDDSAYYPNQVAMSADGRYVVFTSSASNLVGQDTASDSDILLHDRLTRSTRRMSLRSAGTPNELRTYYPTISGNGAFIAYGAFAQLVPEDTTADDDVYATKREVFAPETTITAGPAQGSSTTSKSATFGFKASEAGATFTCSLDNGPFTPCAGTKTYSNLGIGTHTFRVRATDLSSNTDSTPAVRTWTVR